jgi:hypothetical protein
MKTTFISVPNILLKQSSNVGSSFETSFSGFENNAESVRMSLVGTADVGEHPWLSLVIPLNFWLYLKNNPPPPVPVKPSPECLHVLCTHLGRSDCSGSVICPVELITGQC